MKIATAKRPIEQFQTQVTLPEAQIEPDEESYFGAPDNSMMVDPDGNPINPLAPPDDPNDGGTVTITRPNAEPSDAPVPNADGREPPRDGQRLDQDWIDRVTGNDDRRRDRRQPPPRDDSSEDRPNQ